MSVTFLISFFAAPYVSTSLFYGRWLEYAVKKKLPNSIRRLPPVQAEDVSRSLEKKFTIYVDCDYVF